MQDNGENNLDGGDKLFIEESAAAETASETEDEFEAEDAFNGEDEGGWHSCRKSRDAHKPDALFDLEAGLALDDDNDNDFGESDDVDCGLIDCQSLTKRFIKDWQKEVIASLPEDAHLSPWYDSLKKAYQQWRHELHGFTVAALENYDREDLAHTIDEVLADMSVNNAFFINNDDLRKYYYHGGKASLSYEQAVERAKPYLFSWIDEVQRDSGSILPNIKQIHQMRILLNQNVRLFIKLGAAISPALIQRYHNLFAYELAFYKYIGVNYFNIS